MKIDPFQRIALCISVKHFTSFLLLPAKGWPSAKQLINAIIKKMSSQLTGQQNIARAHALSDSFLWSCSTVLNFISSLPALPYKEKIGQLMHDSILSQTCAFFV